MTFPVHYFPKLKKQHKSHYFSVYINRLLSINLIKLNKETVEKEESI